VYVKPSEIPKARSVQSTVQKLPAPKQAEVVNKRVLKVRQQLRDEARDDKIIKNKMFRGVFGRSSVPVNHDSELGSAENTDDDVSEATAQTTQPEEPSLFQSVRKTLDATSKLDKMVPEMAQLLHGLRDEVFSFMNNKLDDAKEFIDDKLAQVLRDFPKAGVAAIDEAGHNFLDLFSSKFMNFTIDFAAAILLVKFTYDCYHEFDKVKATAAIAITAFLAYRHNAFSHVSEFFRKIQAFFVAEPSEGIIKPKGTGTIFESLGGFLSVILSYAVVKTAPPGQVLKNLTYALSGFKRLKEGSIDAVEYAAQCFREFYNKLAQWIGMPDIKAFSTGVHAVDDWSREVLRYGVALRDKKLKFTTAEKDDLVRLYSRGCALLANSHTRSDKNGYQVVLACQKTLQDIMQAFQERGTPIDGPRMVPVAMRIFGAPGTGKSSITIPLTSRLLFEIFKDDPEMLKKLENNIGQFVSPRFNEQKFFDGYIGQIVLVYDEFGQQKVQSVDNEEMEFIRIVSNLPYAVHVAAMEAKGNIYCHPHFVFLFSNNPTINATMVASRDAIMRRIHLNLIVTPRDEFCKRIDGAIPASITQRTLDPNLVPDNFTPEVYQFAEWDGQNATSSFFSYETLISRLVALHRKHTRQANAFIAPVMDEHKARCRARLAELGATPLETTAMGALDPFDNPDMVKPSEVAEEMANRAAAREALKTFKGKGPALIQPKMRRVQKDHDDLVKWAKLFNWSPEVGESTIIQHRDDHSNVPGCRCPDCVTHATDAPNSCTCDVCSRIAGSAQQERREFNLRDAKRQHGPAVERSLFEKFYTDIPLYVRKALGDRYASDLVDCEQDTNWVDLRDTGVFFDAMILFDGIDPLMSDDQRSYYGRAFTQFYNAASTEVQIKLMTPGYVTMSKLRDIARVYDPLTFFDITSRLKKYARYALSATTGFVRWIGANFPTVHDLCEFFLAVTLGCTSVFYLGILVMMAKQIFFPGAPEIQPKSGEIRQTKDKSKPQFVRKKPGEAIKPKMDQGCFDMANSDFYGSLYGVFLNEDDQRPMSNCLFLSGNVAIANLHLYYALKHVFSEEEIEHPDSYIFLRQPSVVTTKPHTWHVHIKDILNNCDITTFEDRDLFTFQVTAKGWQARQDITNHFLSESEFKQVYNVHVFSIVYDWTRNQRQDVIMPGKTGVTGTGYFDMDQTRTVPRKNLISRERYVEDGECGTPWYIDKGGTHGKIIGITMGGTDTTGYASTFLREDCTLALKRYIIKCTGVNVQAFTAPPKVPSPGFNPIAKVPPPSIATKTQIIPSPLQEHMKEVFPIKTKPAKLRPFNLGGFHFDPWSIAVSEYDQPPLPDHRFRYIEKAAPFLLSHLEKVSVVPYPAKVYTTEEAIFGSPLEPDWDGITRQSSPGYDYCLHTDGKPGKTKWLGVDGKPDPADPNYAQLLRDVEEIENSFASGTMPPQRFVAFLDFLKDERLKFEKVDRGQTRYISGANLPMLIVMRKYFGAFNVWSKKNRILNSNTIGVNPHSDEWGMLRDHFGPTPMVADSDVKKMDRSNRAQMIRVIMEKIIITWYKNGGQVDARALAIMQGIVEWLINSYHVLGDMLYQWAGCNSSGNFLTAYINGFAIILGARTALSLAGYYGGDYDDKILPDSLSEIDALHRSPHMFTPDWTEPDRDLRVVVHGDDNIIGYSGHPAMFTPRYFAMFMSYLGYTLTSSDKKELTDEWKTLDQCTFLKRKFERHAMTGKWVAPLSLDTILESPQWTSKQIGSDKIAEKTFDDCMIELAFHHPKVWSEWAPKLQKAYLAAYGHSYPYNQEDNLRRAHSITYSL